MSGPPRIEAWKNCGWPDGARRIGAPPPGDATRGDMVVVPVLSRGLLLGPLFAVLMAGVGGCGYLEWRRRRKVPETDASERYSSTEGLPKV